MTYKTFEFVEFFGEEFRLHIEYNYTEGYSSGYYDPGCDDEFDVIGLWFQRGYHGDAPKFKLSHEAFWALCDEHWVHEVCAADVRVRYEYPNPDGYNY